MSRNTLTLCTKWHQDNNHHTAAVLRLGGCGLKTIHKQAKKQMVMAKYKVTVNHGSRLPIYGGAAGGMELGQAQARLLELWN